MHHQFQNELPKTNSINSCRLKTKINMKVVQKIIIIMEKVNIVFIKMESNTLDNSSKALFMDGASLQTKMGKLYIKATFLMAKNMEKANSTMTTIIIITESGLMISKMEQVSTIAQMDFIMETGRIILSTAKAY